MIEQSTSPMVEDYLNGRALERRTHVVGEKNSYRVYSSLGQMPYAGVLDACLPDYSQQGTVMWVDFVRHTQDGISPEGKPMVRSKAIGEVAIAVGARQFLTAEEIIGENLVTDYLKVWMDRYWPPGQSASFVQRRHPVVEPVRILRDFIKTSR